MEFLTSPQWRGEQPPPSPGLEVFYGENLPEVVLPTSTTQRYGNEAPRLGELGWTSENGKKKVLGKPILFWLVVAIAVLSIVVIILSALVGVFGSRKYIHTTNTTGPTTNTTGPTTNATEPTDLPAYDIDCPAINNTEYTVPETNQTFLIECGKDYPGEDIFRIEAYSMQECLQHCTNWMEDNPYTFPCVGVSWNHFGAQGVSLNYCWLKGAKSTQALLENFTDSGFLVDQPQENDSTITPY